jgi:excisionase family DNA binding protein
MSTTSSPPLETPVRQQIEMALQHRRAVLGDPLLSLRIVRDALGGCSYSYIRSLIASGSLKTFRIGARGHYRVRQSELEKLLAQGDNHNGAK